MVKKILSIVILFLTIILKTNSRSVITFSSRTAMRRLIKTQASVIESLKTIMPQVTKSKQNKVKDFLHRCQKEHTIAMENVTKYLKNPINAFTLVKRLSNDLSSVEKVLQKTTYKRTAKMKYPTKLDNEYAKYTIVSLAKTYSLNITQLANGILISNYSVTAEIFTESVTPMTSSDCFELAVAAFRNGDYALSLAWADEAFRKHHENCENSCPFTKFELLVFVSEVCQKTENHVSTQYWLQKFSNLTEDNAIKSRRLLKSHFKSIYEEQLQRSSLKKTYKVSGSSEDDKFGNFSLCKGGQIVQLRLHCQYQYGPHPFLRLARFKVELLHLEPDIIMFHDIISDDEILTIKKLSLSQFSEASIVETYKAQPLFVRTGLTAFLIDSHTTVATIIRRVLDMSGQEYHQRMEPLQVGYYGPGGFYAPHYDSILGWVEDTEEGNAEIFGFRRFTALFYISEENQGGATVFCELGLTVFPKKNSAIFWKNLFPNGTTDTNTIHGGCPVLHSSKWMVTQWLSDPKDMCDAVPLKIST